MAGVMVVLLAALVLVEDGNMITFFKSLWVRIKNVFTKTKQVAQAQEAVVKTTEQDIKKIGE